MNSEKPVGVSEGFTIWQHPYRNTQIFVHPTVVRNLAAQALRAAKQESEIGGVLWGKAGHDESITIMDATLVQNSGPLFNETSRDSRDIAQALSGRGPQANLSVAGYFRSYVREGLSLTPQDQTLIGQQLRDPDAVFMVIKPFAIGVCTAGLFFWQDGRLQTDTSDLEVPFIAFEDNVHKEPVPLYETEPPTRVRPIRPAMEEPSHPTPVPGPPEEPSIVAMLRESAMRNAPQPPNQAKRVLPNPVPPAAPVPEPERRVPPRLLAAAGIMCLFGVLFATGISLIWPSLRERFQGPPEHPPRANINLQVTRAAGGQLDLNWDRKANDVTRAASATLSIVDGRTSHSLKLDNDQLRSGKLMYFAKSDDVRFRLELNTDSMHTVAESVRVLLPGAAETHETRRVKQATPAADHPTPTARREVTREVADRKLAQSSLPAADLGSQRQRAQESDVRSFPSRPPLTLVPSVVTATSGMPQAQNTPAGTFVPPQVVEEMMPETAPLGQFAQVSVEVSIDQTGRVTAAHPVEDGGLRNGSLTAIATAAALRWRFSPATLNGRPVEAQYRIVFAFHRQLK